MPGPTTSLAAARRSTAWQRPAAHRARTRRSPPARQPAIPRESARAPAKPSATGPRRSAAASIPSGAPAVGAFVLHQVVGAQLGLVARQQAAGLRRREDAEVLDVAQRG